MNRVCSIFTTTPAAIVVSLAASLWTASPARGDCPPVCGPLLCASATTTIVVGEVQADAADVLGWVLVVESALRVPPDARTPQPGERLRSYSLSQPITGRAVGYYQGAALDRPLGVFPIGADGNVHCRGIADATSAPEGMGVPPQRLADLAGDPSCAATLEQAGYPRPGCDDTSGCNVGGGSARPGATAFTFAAAAAVLALVARRRRRQGDRVSE
jgi:MYXO-CTERM domain-containing protein